jgi:hypothetical protein
VLLTSPIPHAPAWIEVDGVRGISANWRDFPAEQSISIGAETSNRGLGLYLCFLATSSYTSRCSCSAATRTAMSFNTFCSSKLCSSSATTLCRFWISATSYGDTCQPGDRCGLAHLACRKGPTGGTKVESKPPQP